MHDDKKHIVYSTEDIQRYLNREMTASEMHQLEKAALEDSFLAEAIEGFIETRSSNISSDIAYLKKRLDKRSFRVVTMRRQKMWRSIAAAAVVLLGMGLTWYWLGAPGEKNIAQQKNKHDTASVVTKQDKRADESAVPGDSMFTAKNEAKELKSINDPQKSQKPAGVSPGTTLAQPSAKQKKEAEPGSQIPDKANTSERVDATLQNIKAKERESLRKDIDISTVGANNVAGYASANIITGKVTDTNNRGLPFVNIGISNTPTSIYSDAHGNFKIMSGDSAVTVTVKSSGFQSKQVTLQTNTSVNNIMLKAQENVLTEVAASGYGAKRKKIVLQDDSAEESPEAEPVDGWENYNTYLANNIRLPGQQSGTYRGLVELSFTADKYGRLENFLIERSTCTACNKEA
ncbi:MAG TPA: carboxypeptidase-like regulatory domain-containing protein, partial [Agriterribacter sp.]|nr:carboxypeptidase-like regulatory domain-containing protein [Agriterribacter sp.]